MNVLLVTGDEDAVGHLRPALRELGHRCTVLLGIDAASRVLELERYDMALVGSDVASDALQILSELAPSTVRVVVTADPTRLGRAAAGAHYLLSHGVDRRELTAVLGRARQAREALATPAVRDLIGEVATVSAVPDLWTMLCEVADDPASSFEDLARVAGADPGLSAKLIGLANSPVFWSPHPIVELTDAVRMLGSELVLHLAMAAGVLHAFDHRPLPTGLIMREIADHGVACCAIVDQLDLDRRDRATARTAALVANIGQLLLGVALPEKYATVVGFARAGAHPLHSLERELFGFSHAEVGALLLRYWGLPDRIVDAVALHHAPTPHEDPVVRAVQLSHLIVQAGAPVGQDPVAVRGPALLDRYATSAGIDLDELPSWAGAGVAG